MQLFKNELDNQNYIKNGYVVCEALSSQEVDSILKNLTSLHPDDNFFPQNRQISNYHCTFLDTNTDYKRAVNKLFKSVFKSVVDRLMVDYKVWNGNFYVKQAGHGKFEIHQNWTHVTDEKQTSFTIWCPFVDTSIENGTLQVVPKSHKITPDIATLGIPYYFSDFEDKLLQDHLIPIPLKAGQCIIFEDGLIHYSDTNNSNSPRYAAQILIGPKNLNPVYYHYSNNNFKVYEINDEFFMTRNYANMDQDPIEFKLLKTISNSNKLLSLTEFEVQMKNGVNRRKKIYE